MNTYEMYQVKTAIRACRGESILRTVCIWCKKALGRYENNNGLGYCYVCRRMLFPKSFAHRKRASNRSPTKVNRQFLIEVLPELQHGEKGCSIVKVTALKEGSEAGIAAVEQ